jgi:putative oxidoreductase
MSKIRLGWEDRRYLALIGRQLFSVIFIIASAGHFTPGTIALASAHGVPMAGLLVPLSGLIALTGGLSVLFGYRARVGGALLVLFLLPVTFTMHDFWAAADPVTFRLELVLFMRNIVLLGCALVVTHAGAGPLSLDAMMERRALKADGAI